MTKDEALRLALEALKEYTRVVTSVNDPNTWIKVADGGKPAREAITAIKAALEAKDEPVAYINVEQRKLEWAKYVSWDTPTVVNLPKIPLYTTPPQRTWVGLTDEDFYGQSELQVMAMKYAEAKLKEKNI
jgi:hypothetical protein